MDQIIKRVVEIAEEEGMTIHDVVREIEGKALLELCLKRMTPLQASSNIVMVSNPLGSRDMYYDMFTDKLNSYELRVLGEYRGFRFVTDDPAPKGMSPSFHHLMKNTRKKKGFK